MNGEGIEGDGPWGAVEEDLAEGWGFVRRCLGIAGAAEWECRAKDGQV